jgi:DegV family protein with EDD domain
MSSRIGVVVDSTCDYPEDWTYRDRVHVIPEHIRFGEQDYREGVDITDAEFFQKVLELGYIPKTSQPSPGEFADFYRELAPQYDVIISLHLGAKLSGTYQSAVLGAEMVADEITVHPVDSNNGSAGVGVMADEAFQMSDAGATPEAILQRMAVLRERIQIFLTPKDLTFPRMSGRVSALGAFVASVLHITPIIILTDGELIASERARSRKKAFAKMVRMMKERLGEGPVNLAIIHSQAPEDVDPLKSALLAAFQPQKLWIAGLSSSVSAHLGPGTIGIVGYRTD